jgi:ABC-2 type transport system permease protein
MTERTLVIDGAEKRTERLAAHSRDARPNRTAVGRLIRAELKLMVRDPLVLTFVFAFPIVTMLIIGGSFGTSPDPDFAGARPSQWYVASYLTVVIAATGLIMLPVHLASYRERGVLRRFLASGFPRFSFAAAQFVVGLLVTGVAAGMLLIVAAPVYGVPAMQLPVRALAGILVGAVAFVSGGVLLGSLLPSARAAQAVGLLLFFPSFLLGSGGPPPDVMGSGLRSVADVLPLTQVTKSIREPWLGLGTASTSLIIVSVLAVAATAAAARRAAL